MKLTIEQINEALFEYIQDLEEDIERNKDNVVLYDTYNNMAIKLNQALDILEGI